MTPRERESAGLASRRPDSDIGALTKPERRMVLGKLPDGPAEVSIESLARDIPGQNARTRFHHQHLPKLADEAYVQWDPRSQTVSTGPHFVALEPLSWLLVRCAEMERR